MAARYRGRPWRSRFLRAPAIALGLAEREDFVALGSVADVSLGLKTGADDFFFVELSKAQNAGDLGRPRGRSTVHAKGFKWEGELPKADLRAALRASLRRHAPAHRISLSAYGAKEADVAAQAIETYDTTLQRLDQEALRRAHTYTGVEQAAETADAVLRLWRHACLAAGVGSGQRTSAALSGRRVLSD